MPVELTRQNEFAVITLNRPEALNALSFEIVGKIGDAIAEAAKTDARALIITGAGDRAFSAGADIKELYGRSLGEQKASAHRGQRLFAQLDDIPMASIALINGYAFGGGMELALACTYRLATPSAKVGLPEIKLGLIPGYGGTIRLPRLVGEGRALELVMTGRTVEAEEAEHIGLVSKIIEGDPMEGAMAFAREFTCYSLPVLKLARESVMRALDVSVLEGLKIEADLNTLAFQTEDSLEGMNAFVDKREAKFKDR